MPEPIDLKLWQDLPEEDGAYEEVMFNLDPLKNCSLEMRKWLDQLLERPDDC
jgi:hypothetical protein